MSKNTPDTNYLNLDDIAPPLKTVTIAGIKYDVLDMTVENFIETNRANKLNKDLDPAEQFDQAVKMLTRFIPTIPEATLRGLNFEKINVLMKFATGELNQEQDKAEPEPTDTATAGAVSEVKKT